MSSLVGGKGWLVGLLVLAGLLALAGYGSSVTVEDNTTHHIRPDATETTHFVGFDAYNETVWAMVYGESDNNVYVQVTTDAGDTWSGPTQINDGTSNLIRTSDTTVHLRYGTEIEWINSTTAVVAWPTDGNNLASDRTTDQGATWGTDVTVDTGVQYQGMDMAKDPNSDKVYLQWLTGSPGGQVLIANTTDGGQSWSSPVTAIPDGDGDGPNLPGRTLRVLDNSTVGIVYHSDLDAEGQVSSFRYTYSTDGGNTWTDGAISGTNSQAEMGMGFDMTEEGFGVAVKYNGTAGTGSQHDMMYYTTTDGGASWSTQEFLQTDSVSDGGKIYVNVIDEDTWLASFIDESTCQWAPSFIYTTDGGSTFTEHETTPCEDSVISGETIDDAIGQSGGWIDESSGLYASSYPGAQIQLFANANLSAPGPSISIPMGDIVESDAQTTAPCFVRDLDTNYDETGWSVYVRDQIGPDVGCQGPDTSESAIWRLDKQLNTASHTATCTGNDYQKTLNLFGGLSVTYDSRVVFTCTRSATTSGSTEQLSLHLGNADGFWASSSGPEALTVGGDNVQDWDRTETHLLPVESRSGNRVLAFGEEGSLEANGSLAGGGERSMHPSMYDFGAADSTEDNSINAWDVSQSEGEKKWVAYTGPSGTFVYYNVDGGLVAGALGGEYDSVEIQDEALWTGRIAASGGQLVRWNVTEGGSISESVSVNYPIDGFIESSKDGRYLLAVNGTQGVTLFNGTTLDPLATTNNSSINVGAGERFIAADMDVNNNYIYAATLERVLRYPVYNYTVSHNGTAGMDGQENPTPIEPFLEDKETTTGTDGGTPTDPSTGFAGLSVSNIVDAFGISETAAGWFLGVLLMLGLGAGFWGLTKSGAGAMVGAIGGIGLSMAFGWLPTWFVVLAFAAFMAVVLVRAGGD